MLRYKAQLLFGVIWALSLGCGPGANNPAKQAAPAVEKDKLVAAGEGCAERLQEALIAAQPGDVIELEAGNYDFAGSLSLDVERVTLRGAGMDKTILSFKGQQAGSGGEGLLITSHGCLVEDLAVEDAPGDAVKVKGADGITLRRVRAEWTGGAKETNGGYGLYPVECENVLIEECVAKGASDAGIYVGQSENIIVRRNRVETNVAGLEIENCIGADVYQNVCTNNAGGLLVFSLPDLPAIKNGRQCRVFGNRLIANNHVNFAAPTNIVAKVPSGTGMMIMASDEIEVFDNTFEENQGANLAIISYMTIGEKMKDPNYDPWPEGISIHDNKFVGGGDNPTGVVGNALKIKLGGSLPDILYDGEVNSAKLVEGSLPPELQLCISNNGDADFANLKLAKSLFSFKQVRHDLSAHAGSLPPLPAIKLTGAE